MANTVKYILLLPLCLILSCDAIIPTDYELLAYAWTKTFGGSDSDIAYALTTDIYGNIYVGGCFRGTADFNPGTGNDDKTSVGDRDAFLTRINADGSYTWTKTFGGSVAAYADALITDINGNIYVGGYFSGTADFDPGTGIDNKTSAGSSDAFLTRINADGSYAWTKTFGGSEADFVYAITTDIYSNIYVGGFFTGTADFDPGAGVDNMTSAGSSDAFLTRINADGSYAWTKTFGGGGTDVAYALTTDINRNIYVGGYFSGIADFDPGTGVDNKTSAGSSDAFLTRINADGSYAWTKTFGGSETDFVYTITTDIRGNIYLAGCFLSQADFDPGPAIEIHTSSGSSDCFLIKIKRVNEIK